MTLAELKRRLPARTLGTLVAGLVVAVGFVAVFLIPEYREAATLRMRIAALHSDIEIQRQLAPVRASLKKAEGSLPPGNLRLEPEPLPLSEIGQLAVIMGGMAKPLGLTVDSVSPDASSVSKNGQLAVKVQLRGALESMREFLLALCRFAPLVKVESATTQLGGDGRELTLKCWLAVR